MHTMQNFSWHPLLEQLFFIVDLICGIDQNHEYGLLEPVLISMFIELLHAFHMHYQSLMELDAYIRINQYIESSKYEIGVRDNFTE